MGVGIVSTKSGEFTFQSADEVIKFVRTTAQENKDMWISGEQPYPCIAVCIKGEYAAVNFFQNETDRVWVSYNDKNEEEVTFDCFFTAGSTWKAAVDVIITLNDAFSCIREFLDTYKRPTCIQWMEL